MKRILSCVLVCVLFSGASLWALRGAVNGRTFNRDIQKQSGHERWARAYGADSDGSISTFAEIEVDWEYFTERSYPPLRRGHAYSAYANVWGEGRGSWSAYASVPGDDDPRNGLVRGDTYRAVDASNFRWFEGPDALNSLALSNAWSTISVVNHSSRADAYKFE